MLSEENYSLFNLWYNHSKESYTSKGIANYNAFVLSTADKNGVVSARTLLLKKYDITGFVFFTNENSLKGNILKENDFVSMTFYWNILGRQIRISGTAKQTADNIAEEYFVSRPYLSKLAAWSSAQSTRIDNYNKLISDVLKYARKFSFNIPKPPFWKGYKISPNSIEFWQELNGRLHKRTLYSILDDGRWDKTFLAP